MLRVYTHVCNRLPLRGSEIENVYLYKVETELQQTIKYGKFVSKD